MPRKPSNSLDNLDRQILVTLREWVEKYKFPPTVREIQARVGASSTSVVYYHLNKLERLGYIKRRQGAARRSRNIILLLPGARDIEPSQEEDFLAAMGVVPASPEHAAESAKPLVEIPVAGRIVAGSPLPSFTEGFTPEDVVEVPQALLPRPSGRLYALEVSGDSMIDAMVQDGDVVILEAVEEAFKGDMVAAWLRDRDEATLKYYIPDGDKVILRPANASMQDIVIEDPSVLEIKGRVMLVIHRVDGATCTYTVHRKCL